MPWTPILARPEEQQQGQTSPVGRLAGDREQLIGLINACQQCLGELLRRLHAARVPGRDPDGPAQSDLMDGDTSRAEEAVAATLARLEQLVPGQPVPTVRPEEVDAVRATIEQLSARLTRLDGGIEERMLRTADLAARGAEVAMQDRLKGLRGDIEAVRKLVGDATADLRGVLGRDDAARAGELAALRSAIDGVRADVVRLDSALDGRIRAKVDAAWRVLDAELVRLRTRIEAVVASSSAGLWPALGRALRDPFGTFTAAAGFLRGRLVG